VEERRRTFRQRTLKGARIVLNDGFSTFDCTVRNLSPLGARLKVASIIGIPDRFELQFDDGRKFACRVAWRQEEDIGVEFVQS
jgi:hypothetical protein